MSGNNLPYEQFIGDWRLQQHLPMTGPEAKEALEKAAGDLARQAMKAGLRQELAEAIKPYRSMAHYVKAMCDGRASDGDKKR